MTKRLKMLASVLCATMVLGGCTEGQAKDNDSSQTADTSQETKEESPDQSKLNVIQPMAYSDISELDLEKGTYISVIGRAKGTPFWDEIERGVRQAEKDINDRLGYKGEDKVKVLYNSPAEMDDVDDQINILDEELSRYPDAVAIASIDAAACEVQFDLAAENGIPIIEFDSGSNYKNIMAKVKTNNAEATHTAAEQLVAYMGGAGEIAVFANDSHSVSALEREQGFVSYMQEKHPEITRVEVYHLDELEEIKRTIADEESAGKAEEEKVAAADISDEKAIQSILEKNPNFTGIFLASAEASKTVLNVVETAGLKDLSIVSYDGGESQMQALEDGQLEGLIIQNPYGIGYATVVAAARTVLGLPNQAVVDTGYTWVTKENMQDTSIQQMLY